MGGCFSSPSSAPASNLKGGDAAPSNQNLHSNEASLRKGASVMARLQREAAAEAELRRIQTRLVNNGQLTRCSLYSEPGKKGPNQDTMIAWEGFCGTDDIMLCAVFDGHGPYGHLVSHRIRESLPIYLAHAAVARSLVPPGTFKAGKTSIGDPPYNTRASSKVADLESDKEGSTRFVRRQDHNTELANGTEEMMLDDSSTDASPSLEASLRGANCFEQHLTVPKAGDTSPTQDVPGGKGSMEQDAGDTMRGSRNFLEYASLAAGNYPGIELSNPWTAEASAPPGPLEFSSAWAQAIQVAFAQTDADIRGHPSFDTYVSGAAAIAIIQKGVDLVIANLGDSRAVIGSRTPSGNVIGQALSKDHKCASEVEKARIESTGARVFALEDEPHIPRVWLPKELMPGLAMSRAFGDSVLKPWGLISAPETFHRQLEPHDLFVILASDGVWDVISDQEAAVLVEKASRKHIDGRFAAQSLVAAAVKAWGSKNPRSKRDDATAIVVQFHHPGAPACQQSPSGNEVAPPHSPVQEIEGRVLLGEGSSSSIGSSISDSGNTPYGQLDPDTICIGGRLKFEKSDSIGNLVELGELPPGQQAGLGLPTGSGHGEVDVLQEEKP